MKIKKSKPSSSNKYLLVVRNRTNIEYDYGGKLDSRILNGMSYFTISDFFLLSGGLKT